MTVSVLFAKAQDLISIQNALGNPKVLSIGNTGCTDMMNDSVVNEVVFADFGLTEAQVMEVLYNTDDVDFYPCGCVEGTVLYSPLYGDVLASDGVWWSQNGDYMGVVQCSC